MSCLFCGIAAGDVPAQIVRETERTIAFRDLHPVAPTHILVISRDHFPTAADVADADPSYAGELVAAAAAVAQQEGLTGGYRLVANTGDDAGQSVLHVHLHVLGGRSLGWPPG